VGRRLEVEGRHDGRHLLPTPPARQPGCHASVVATTPAQRAPAAGATFSQSCTLHSKTSGWSKLQPFNSLILPQTPTLVALEQRICKHFQPSLRVKPASHGDMFHFVIMRICKKCFKPGIDLQLLALLVKII
jgi:hypothetical protein